mmetsp:Transcript_11524/g.42141  ORF Transcript_11524/g.42141 Transcript_11524/m.42141 type:complete len:391 (+) Transcript_11524:324-1496(+)
MWQGLLAFLWPWGRRERARSTSSRRQLVRLHEGASSKAALATTGATRKDTLNRFVRLCWHYGQRWVSRVVRNVLEWAFNMVWIPMLRSAVPRLRHVECVNLSALQLGTEPPVISTARVGARDSLGLFLEMQVSWRTNRATADVMGQVAGLQLRIRGEPVFHFDGTLLFALRLQGYGWCRLPKLTFFFVNSPSLELRMRPSPLNRHNVVDLLTRTYIWTVLDAPLRFLFTKQIVPLLPSMPNLPSYQLVPSSSAENVLDVTSRQQEGSAAYLSVVEHIVLRQRLLASILAAIGWSCMSTRMSMAASSTTTLRSARWTDCSTAKVGICPASSPTERLKSRPPRSRTTAVRCRVTRAAQAQIRRCSWARHTAYASARRVAQAPLRLPKVATVR